METPKTPLTGYSLLLVLLLIALSPSLLRKVAGDDDDDDDRPHPLSNLGGLKCVHKLMPCKPFLDDELKQPELCCNPVKELLDENEDCLCDIYNNARLLDKLDVTRDQLTNLPKQCGLDNKPDSFCKEDDNGGGESKSSASRVPLSSANYAIVASFLLGTLQFGLYQN